MTFSSELIHMDTPVAAKQQKLAYISSVLALEVL